MNAVCHSNLQVIFRIYETEYLPAANSPEPLSPGWFSGIASQAFAGMAGLRVVAGSRPAAGTIIYTVTLQTYNYYLLSQLLCLGLVRIC